jgi:hypothetical protein
MTKKFKRFRVLFRKITGLHYLVYIAVVFCYTYSMKNLFNKSFYRFTFGFIGIILLSLSFAFIISNMQKENSIPVNASRGS